MRANFCDLCGGIIKGRDYYCLLIIKPTTEEITPESYLHMLGQIEKDKKDVCPTCKEVFDKMFELRLHKLSQLAIEITKIVKLPTKPNPKERNKGKDKNGRKFRKS